ncbi:MAG TPA: twin-arginine translocase TatA/TatE family subunit [Candidatus Cybelea sp.]|jgi:TatA/E family protein of Tat protein translocase|nr:twin-arginine translocase TatA/TatE family subunit [Candidatus Cybelea sp.]
MFSVPDILVIGVLGLLLFGPDRLPKVMRQAGRFMRDVQNTSQSFIAEMERAADTHEPPPASVPPWRESGSDEPPWRENSLSDEQPELPLGERVTEAPPTIAEPAPKIEEAR